MRFIKMKMEQLWMRITWPLTTKIEDLELECLELEVQNWKLDDQNDRLKQTIRSLEYEIESLTKELNNYKSLHED